MVFKLYGIFYTKTLMKVPQFENKSIGLVLSGGGVRGMAHIGIIKAMEEFGLEAKIVNFSQELGFSGSVIEGTPGQSLSVNISQLTFGMPYFNVEGSLVYSYREEDVIGAEALALAIPLLESEFKRNATKGLSYNSYYYGKRFKLILATAFKAATTGSGTVGATGSGTGGGLKVYVPCA